MKETLIRIMAFALDVILVTAIAIALSYINLINPNNKKINTEYQKLSEVQKQYKDITTDLNEKYYEDKILTEIELSEIASKYGDFINAFKDINKDEELPKETKETISNNLADIYKNNSNSIAYKINKYNIPQVIISLIIYILYFGVLQCFLGGQTLFKKLFKLKVVNNNNEEKKIPLWNYLIRAILISEALVSIADLICLMTLKMNSYIPTNYYFMQLKYIYEMTFILVMLIRNDNRSVHDLLLKTKVIKIGNIFEKRIVKASKVND